MATPRKLFQNRTLNDWFKPKTSIPYLAPSPTSPVATAQPSSDPKGPLTPISASKIPIRPSIINTGMGNRASTVSNTEHERPHTSNPSPSPSGKSAPSEHLPLPENKVIETASPGSPPQTGSTPELLPMVEDPVMRDDLPQPPHAIKLFTGREIQNSEDEDDNSSSDDFPELPSFRPSQPTPRPAPMTPKASKRYNDPLNFHSSPLTVLPKYKFDLKSLARRAEADDAAEASSKRMKAMTESDDGDDEAAFDESTSVSTFTHSALLEEVAAEREDGGAHKVKRAIMRTEATVAEQSWYFFDTKMEEPRSGKNPFPTTSIPRHLKDDFADPQNRRQTFVSGFAEDVVTLGDTLPDELFLWMLDEVCLEKSNQLRNSYLNVMIESPEQIRRLLLPERIRKLFLCLGGTSTATTLTEKAKPVQSLSDPYPNREWSRLYSIIVFLGQSQVARCLTKRSRIYVVSMLVRMSVDQIVFDNVDILDGVQTTISRLCQHIPDEQWNSSCEEICGPLFKAVNQPSFRLRMIGAVPSSTPRTHELRRRLAMCCYFNNLQYSSDQTHILMDFDNFFDSLTQSSFSITPSTDYRELAALVLLLDVAIDDGRSTMLNMTDSAVDTKFNEDIDGFAAAIKHIMKNIGNPGAAFISRIEAKEAMELVSQRIADTLRSKPKARHQWFDGSRGRREEDLQAEKKGMSSFVMKMRTIGTGVEAESASNGLKIES